MRLRIVTPALLLSRLERRLPWLTGGDRDVPTRQQTMRDSIAWSYDLLESSEQMLFRYLSAFVGGISFAAAEHLATVVLAHGEQPVDALAGLVESSLLRSAGSGREHRFVMLETVREYGLEMLEACGETRAARDAQSLEPNHLTPGTMFDGIRMSPVR